ncbi:hypothetical protein [Teredinibacter turnerae]|uniref:hypothetical protein n=1 Tax=Teredinibacter turnerae TaxID=2426 RepID=UPI001E3499D6|nr:hypothetical protein [Teredinibacter turnerae]
MVITRVPQSASKEIKNKQIADTILQGNFIEVLPLWMYFCSEFLTKAFHGPGSEPERPKKLTNISFIAERIVRHFSDVNCYPLFGERQKN